MSAAHLQRFDELNFQVVQALVWSAEYFQVVQAQIWSVACKKISFLK